LHPRRDTGLRDAAAPTPRRTSGIARPVGEPQMRAGANSVGQSLFTWIFTGRQSFGQQGHAASLHLPGLGVWFVLIVPVVAGLLYGR
jgi:hypothetical protein